jgi:hypothetical protein
VDIVISAGRRPGAPRLSEDHRACIERAPATPAGALAASSSFFNSLGNVYLVQNGREIGRCHRSPTGHRWASCRRPPDVLQMPGRRLTDVLTDVHDPPMSKINRQVLTPR